MTGTVRMAGMVTGAGGAALRCGVTICSPALSPLGVRHGVGHLMALPAGIRHSRVVLVFVLVLHCSLPTT